MQRYCGVIVFSTLSLNKKRAKSNTNTHQREQRYNGNVEIMAKVEIEDNYNFAAFPGFWRRRDSISHAVGSPLVIVGQT